ncbi:ATP binding region ATPase isoform 2 [Schistosoma japonicum]|uniref:ATP binding region ATPase isoform 2 n=1 Tax=Schistosoma japonicum TaxID=6182 RepID=A0A4Z2CMV1_SCHJA|nr:ATP binding region ATPase isoform 2 [Schistosoma japonicum]
MPFPEPIPTNFNLQQPAGPLYHFRSIDDVNNLIQMLLWKISQEHRYTGLGCLQEELIRHYPSAIDFLKSIRTSIDFIPRIVEHRKLIQRINTHLWAYAATRNVLTLTDMEELVRLESPSNYRLLGPIVRLPAALEILQTTEFDQRIVTCFTVGCTNQALKMCTEDILEELRLCICKNRYRLPSTVSRGSVSAWWESIFAQHMLGVLDGVRVVQHNQSHKLDLLAKYGIRIKGFSHLVQEITSNLRPENLNKAARLAQDQLDNDIRQLYETFATSLLSKSALQSYRSMKPISVLKHLANCSTQLHNELQSWAEERSLVWPKGHLDSLLVFGQFMQRIAATGPFRTLVHLLILIFNTESMDIKKLLTRVVSSVPKTDRVLESSSVSSTAVNNPELIDLTTNSDDDLCEISPQIDDVTTHPRLTEIIDKFNNLLCQQQQDGNVNKSNNLWLSLASLEREILTPINKNSQSLLSLLYEAINQDVNSVNLPSFNISNIQQDQTVDIRNCSESNSEKIGAPQEDPSTSSDLDPGLVLDFVQKLTCISLRSKEELCKLVCENLNIIHSPKLDQFIDSVLSQLTDDNEMNKVKPLVYHHRVHLPSILTMEEIQRSSSTSDIVSRLLTQRECVLNFLSACPSLVDLEVWSQWHQDYLFYDRWGSLDSFLIESGADKVCGQFNLIAVRLLPFGGIGDSPLLRLTAHPSLNDLKKALEKWQYSRNLFTVRLVIDYIIGAVIKANKLTSEQVCSTIVNQFTTVNTSDSNEWIYFVYSLMMELPFRFLGLVFYSIIIPSFESAGMRSSTSWPLDIPDISLANSSVSYSLLHILFHNILPLNNTCTEESNSQLDRIHLISSVGSIGYQLKWPAYIKYFEENRFKLIDTPVTDATNHIVDSDKIQNADVSCQLSTISIIPSLPEPQITSGNDNDGGALSSFELFENNEDNLANTPILNNDVNGNDKHIMITTDSKDVSDRCRFIEEIRRREFGLGVELSDEAADLVHRVEEKLSRSLVQLSEELYGLPGHFLLELIQNADDNAYDANDVPTLEFHLSTITSTVNNNNESNISSPQYSLLVMNNESVGFSENDMSALCDIGQSTKITQRDAKIGRKGIGFKSVFNITNTPEVHSNGFHVRFHRQSKAIESISPKTPSLILIPEWCNELLMKNSYCKYYNEIPEWCKTLFVLPLNSEIVNNHSLVVQSPGAYVTQLIQTTLNASLMLFLRRLQCLTFSSVESNIFWSLKRTSKTLSTLSLGKIKCFAELITVHEVQSNLSVDGEKNTLHKWFCFKEIIPVDMKELNKSLPSQTEISLAVSLTDPEPLQPCPIFSYLPVRSVGLRFFVNADFDLTSSREDVDSTSAWNRWIVGKIPNVFSDMIECIEKLPLSCFIVKSDSPQSNADDLGFTRIGLIGRIISCLPYNLSTLCPTNFSSVSYSVNRSMTSIMTSDNVFFGLPNQLRAKLSHLAWLPGVRRMDNCLPNIDSCQYVIASRLLVVPTLLSPTAASLMSTSNEKDNRDSVEKTNSITSSSNDHVLLRLLIDYLEIFEPHPEVLLLNYENSSVNSIDDEDIVKDAIEIDSSCQANYLISRMRMESLSWLGAQSISIESLLDLATNLKPEDIKRPGLLSILISSLEACLSAHTTSTSNWGPQSSSNPPTIVSRRRLLTALQHLPIFPLTSGHCIRLNDKQKHSWSNDIHPVVLLPPQPSEVTSMLIGITFDDYIHLLEKLGPIIKPDAFHQSNVNYHKEYSHLLTGAAPIGLGLQIASPSVVLNNWIIPYLKLQQDNVDEVSVISQMTWYLAVGQFYASVDFSDNRYEVGSEDEFCSMLPIVVSNKFGEDFVLPALCNELGFQRVKPIILPPASFTIASLSSSASSSAVTTTPTSDEKNFMEELEVYLFKFLIEQLNDSDCIYTVSAKYFQGSSIHPHQGYRWYNLFSKAGVCTLLSVHKVKYLYQISTSTNKHDIPSLPMVKDVIPLPENHRLQNSIIDALQKQGLTSTVINTSLNTTNNRIMYLIEDYISPGIDLLVSCITRLQNKLTGKEIAERLSCLLHDNWSSYNAVQSAFFTRIKSEDDSLEKLNSAVGLPTVTTVDTLHFLTYSTWLYKLRETAWLPIEPATISSSPPPIELMRPTDPCLIYSPVAFFQLESQSPQLSKLLKETCNIWSPGSYIVSNPLNSQFTKAIGLIDQLDLSTFETLMKRMGQKVQDNLIDSVQLTPDLMLFIYRTAVQYYLRLDDCSQTIDSSMGQSLIDWLRLVFANPTYPCILVQCINTITSKMVYKRSRKDTTTRNYDIINSSLDISEGIHYACPICNGKSRSSSSVESTTGKRRHHSNTSHNSVVVDIDGGTVESNLIKPVYHLVDIDLVCWESVVTDDLLNDECLNDDFNTTATEGSVVSNIHRNEESNEDVGEYFDDQCILVNSSMGVNKQKPITVKTINRPRVFVLSKCYGSESRQFFVEMLGLPSTSTIDEILALRPNLPHIITMINHSSTMTLQMKKSLHDFNKKLSHWYALLDYCLREEYFTEQRRLHNHTESSMELNKCVQLAYIKQYPILLDSMGQWHRPCDIVTLTTSSTDNNGNNNNDENISSRFCLFAWSKSMHAHLIHEISRKQLNTDETSHENITSCYPYRVMAHSLNCLNARYSGSNYSSNSFKKFSTTEALGSTSFLLDRFTPSAQYACEGTAHGLLLDLLSVPIIDRIGELCIKHHHGSNSVNSYSDPTFRYKSDSFMIPCRSLDLFLKGLLRLIMLWLSSSTQLSPNAINRNATSTEDLIDRNILNAILESKEINAFLVDHLQIALKLTTSSNSTILNSTIIDIPKRFIGCFLHGKLFLDSTLGVSIFSNLSQILPDHGAQLIYLLLGSMNDPLLKNSTELNSSSEDSLLTQIIDFICPYGGQKKINLIQFIQGFLNLALSVQPDLPVIINQQHLNSTFLNQLENYLISHGVKQHTARRQLHLLCPLPPPTSLPSASSLPVSTEYSKGIEVTVSSTSTSNQPITASSFQLISPNPPTFSTNITTQSTRFDTTLSAMQGILAFSIIDIY